MAIVYDPMTGQSVFCSEGRVKDFIRQGYRTNPVAPIQVVAAPDLGESMPSSAPPSSSAVADVLKLSGDVNVNSASLKDLAALPQVGTVLARRVRDNRPYTSVEDLIAKVSDVDWLALATRINTNPVEEASNAPDSQATEPPV